MTAPRPVRRLSDAQIDEMATLRERGWGLKRIAEHFGEQGVTISAGAISWQCLRVGADAPPRLQTPSYQRSDAYVRGDQIVRPYSTDEDAQIKALEADHNMAQIARKLGRKANSVQARLMTLARRDARAEQKAGAAQ